MTLLALDERAEARADLCRWIAQARRECSLPARTSFEGVLIAALRVAQNALPAGSVERTDVDVALAVYDDGMETLMHRSLVPAEIERSA